MKFGSSPLAKAIVVAGVALLLLIPVQMLRGLVLERAQLREQAVASVSRGWGGRQLIGGPLLAIPTTFIAEDGHSVTRDWYVLAESLSLEAELDVQDERRKLGVYEVPVYVTKLHAVAKFDVASKLVSVSAARRSATVHLERARLLIPVSDARGVRDVKLNGAALVRISSPTAASPSARSAPHCRPTRGSTETRPRSMSRHRLREPSP